MSDRTLIVEAEHQRAWLLKFIERQVLPFQAVVGPVHEQRSVTANARLWLLHTAAAEHTGYSPEEMHEFALCRHFGFAEKKVADLFTGEITVKRIPNKRSSTRSPKEFRDFMDATEAWYGSEFGVWLGQEEMA